MSFWFKSVRIVAVAAVALGVGVASAATTLSSSSSAEFRLDTREGPRESDGSEVLTYSSLWNGDSSSVVAIAQVCDTPHTTNGTLVAGLGGEGEWDWAAQYDGVYTLSHATVTGGATGKVETAVFVVTGLGLPLMTIEASGYEGAYDGRGHGIHVTVTDPTYATVGYALAAEGPYSNDQILFTNEMDEAVSVWYAVEAEGYTSATNFATVKIDRAVMSELTADVAWKYLQASGTYFAHLEVTCTNGLPVEVECARFLFADRIGDDGSLLAALWNTPGRAANANTAEYDGVTYRCVDLDASLITADDVPATYGVLDIGASQIPVGERTIEMYVQKRVVPEPGNEGAANVGDFVGFLYWESGGQTSSVPVVARSSRSFSSLRAIAPLAAPVSAARLNAALAVGVMPGVDGEPYCRFSEFSADGGTIRGKVEVGANGQAGAPGANARIVLLKGDSPGGAMSELCTVEVGPDGSFSVPVPEDARFFKLALEIGEVAE